MEVFYNFKSLFEYIALPSSLPLELDGSVLIQSLSVSGMLLRSPNLSVLPLLIYKMDVVNVCYLILVSYQNLIPPSVILALSILFIQEATSPPWSLEILGHLTAPSV